MLTQKTQILLAILMVWDLIWKGIALWWAAQRRERNWFIAILILNTIGIVPLIYLYLHRNSKEDKTEQKGTLEIK